MYDIIPVTGHIGGECFLAVSPESAVLLDTGFDFCAERTVENIRSALGGRPLDCILATHSHYDHVSGAATIRHAFPGCRIVGSRHAQKVLAKENAREQMRLLNAGYARDAGFSITSDRIDDLAVDEALDDGDTLRLPGMTIRAVATPGHTRCAMSYYFEEEGLLACSETIGIVPAYPQVVPCMIVGYRSTIDSIGRSRALRPRHVFVSHYGLIPDGEADVFFDNAHRAVEGAVSLLVELHERGSGEEEIVEAFREAYHAPAADLQPERAFVLNTEALIPRILGELGKLPQKTA